MIFVFDIDDTILCADFIDGRYFVKKWDHDIVDSINKLFRKGHTIIIQTGRHWNHLKDTMDHLEFVGVPYHALTMGKPYADYYIDDKNLTPQDFINKLSEILND